MRLLRVKRAEDFSPPRRLVHDVVVEVGLSLPNGMDTGLQTTGGGAWRPELGQTLERREI
jgi:hypothetical protein